MTPETVELGTVIAPSGRIVILDPKVSALLEEPVGSVFERAADAEEFKAVTDWKPEGD